jgi:hypothetical protein
MSTLITRVNGQRLVYPSTFMDQRMTASMMTRHQVNLINLACQDIPGDEHTMPYSWNSRIDTMYHYIVGTFRTSGDR